MSKTFRLLIYTVIVMSIVFAAAGCAQTPAEEEQDLSIWINGRDSFIGPNEQQLPQDQWYISQAIKRFEEANPGVSITLMPVFPIKREKAQPRATVSSLVSFPGMTSKRRFFAGW